jgi:hypothetical protein
VHSISRCDPNGRAITGRIRKGAPISTTVIIRNIAFMFDYLQPINPLAPLIALPRPGVTRDPTPPTKLQAFCFDISLFFSYCVGVSQYPCLFRVPCGQQDPFDFILVPLGHAPLESG